MSDLVGNPEDQFSPIAPYFENAHEKKHAYNDTVSELYIISKDISYT